MKTYCKTVDNQIYFAVTDVDSAYHDTLRGFYYSEFETGFGRGFPATIPDLDQIYANFARAMPDMILQTAGQQPVPWEQCLLALLERLDGQGIDWWLVGSGALAARGLPVRPHDIDLVVQGQGCARMGELLRDCLVEPVFDSRGWVWDWFGRCFLHARLEWVGNVNARSEQDGQVDFGPTALARSESIQWRGYAMRVPPLDLQLAVSERRGLTERAGQIRAWLENSVRG